MLVERAKAKLQYSLRNIGGWNTNRQIVAFESDDWGSIRMPSKAVYEKMMKLGIRVDKCPYSKYDSLESKNDLEELFGVLSSIKDYKGHSPVLSANFVVANPDFDKILKSSFETYHYELFTDTYKRYYGDDKTFETLINGYNQGLFFPQFHGREHLNINRWLKALQQNLTETRQAFENEMFGVSTSVTSESRKSYLAAFDLDCEHEIDDHKKIITEGLDLFYSIFGYRSQGFVASNYVWHNSLEDILFKGGVKYIKGTYRQIEPRGSNLDPKVYYHRLGEKNSNGQVYLTRNVYFEPSLSGRTDTVPKCLQEIKNAFKWGKPAIICTHRLNYIGNLDKSNRGKNLQLLTDLLSFINQIGEMLNL